MLLRKALYVLETDALRGKQSFSDFTLLPRFIFFALTTPDTNVSANFIPRDCKRFHFRFYCLPRFLIRVTDFNKAAIFYDLIIKRVTKSIIFYTCCVFSIKSQLTIHENNDRVFSDIAFNT